MPDYGVLQEQGFVAGNGLGFNPVSEQEQRKLKEEKDNAES